MFYHPRDEWVVLDAEKWKSLRDRFPEDDPRILGWRSTAKDLTPATRLRFFVGKKTALPKKMFESLTNVRELAMPARWLSSLTPDLVPPRLELLDLDGDESVKWPATLALPRLRYLVYTGVALHVTPAQVPALRGLAVSAGARSKVTPHLRNWPQLLGLHLTVVNDDATLAAAPLERLEHLGIVGGKLASVRGLAGKPIKSLQLKNLSKLTSLAGLEQMPKLERLNLQYLTHVKDLELLLTLPHLTRASSNTGTPSQLAALEAHVKKNRARARKRK